MTLRRGALAAQLLRTDLLCVTAPPVFSCKRKKELRRGEPPARGGRPRIQLDGAVLCRGIRAGAAPAEKRLTERVRRAEAAGMGQGDATGAAGCGG